MAPVSSLLIAQLGELSVDVGLHGVLNDPAVSDAAGLEALGIGFLPKLTDRA